jgi:hypothetical protein
MALLRKSIFSLYSEVVGPIFFWIDLGLDDLVIQPLQIVHSPAVMLVMSKF